MNEDMKTGSLGTATPNLIRAACRSRFYKGLKYLSGIAEDKGEKSADRIRAMDTLGRFGLGAADQAQVHIHAGDGAQIIGVVRLPVLGETIAEVQGETGQDGATGHASGPSPASAEVVATVDSALRLLAPGPEPEGPTP